MIYFQTLDYYDHGIYSLIQSQKVSSCPPRVSKLIFRQSRKTLLHVLIYMKVLKTIVTAQLGIEHFVNSTTTEETNFC